MTISKVALDLGGSAIREQYIGMDVNKLDSQFEVIPMNSRIFEDITEKHSDFTILKATRTDAENKRYARGEARNFLRGIKSQVDNTVLKVDQVETYVNAIHAVATSLLNNGKTDADVIVGVCIPTSEFFSAGADRIKESLSGAHSVKFNLLDKTVDFNVKRVLVFPEGVIATLDLMKDNKIKELIMSKTGIIVDAGRRSTDITIMKNGRPVAGAARSLPIGGLNLEAIVAVELENLGYMISGAELAKAVGEGFIVDGNNHLAIGSNVQSAKEVLTGSIAEGIVEVLATRTMSLREISYIVYIGRCFDSKAEGTPHYTGDLGKSVIEKLGTSITRINVNDNELANVKAVANALARVEA